MKVREVFLSKEAVSDIEAGMHNKKFGFYRAFSKRFPFAIYYEVEEDVVKASLNM